MFKEQIGAGGYLLMIGAAHIGQDFSLDTDGEGEVEFLEGIRIKWLLMPC